MVSYWVVGLVVLVCMLIGIFIWRGLKRGYQSKIDSMTHLKETELSSIRATLKYESEKAKDLQKGLVSLNEELKREREKMFQMGSKYATANAKYQGLDKEFQLYKKETNNLREHFYKEFRHLADDILEEKSKKFSVKIRGSNYGKPYPC